MNSTLPQLGRNKWSADVRRWLPLIVGLAVGIRMALGWMHPFKFPDWTDYDALARALVAHRPYEVGGNIATRMPGYPVFVALIYAITGAGAERAVVIVQALLSGGIVLLTYLIGRRISSPIALLAATLVAIDPLSIGFSAALLTETPFTLLLMIALWLCLRISEDPALNTQAAMRWAALGIIWGLAVYFRASALWAILPLTLWAAWNSHQKATTWRILMPTLAVAMVFLLLTPWLVRNYRLFHSGPLRLTTLEGISLYESVYPDADGSPKQDKLMNALPPEMLPLNEAQRNDEWSRRAWHYIQTDPLRIAKLAFLKAGRTWSPWLNAEEFRAGPIQVALTLWHVALFAMAMVGIARGLATSHAALTLLLLLPIAYFTAIHALFLGSVRYRVPLMPIVCLLAAMGVFSCFSWWGERKRLVG